MVYAVPSAGLARSTEVQLRFQKEENKGKKKKHEEKRNMKKKIKRNLTTSNRTHVILASCILSYSEKFMGRVVTLGVKTASSDNKGRRS